jgi:hypothetical protein
MYSSSMSFENAKRNVYQIIHEMRKLDEAKKLLLWQ